MNVYVCVRPDLHVRQGVADATCKGSRDDVHLLRNVTTCQKYHVETVITVTGQLRLLAVKKLCQQDWEKYLWASNISCCGKVVKILPLFGVF